MSLDLRLMEILETRKRADLQRGSAPIGTGGSGRQPPDGPLEPRVQALESSVASIHTTLAVMSEQMKHLATREDVQNVRTEIAAIYGKLDTSAAAVSGKIDTNIVALSGRVDTTVAAFSSKIDRMTLATDLAELKGRVARIPTVPTLTSILVFVSLLFAAASWALRHLPPAWTAVLQ